MASILVNVIAYFVIKLCHCVAIKMHFVLLQQGLDLHKGSANLPISSLLCAGLDDDKDITTT